MRIDPERFGGCSRAVVERLLHFTARLLELFSETKGPKPVRISYRHEGPMCANYGAVRVICLSVRGDHWCQWIYQFAHEYCHHLIDGELTGSIRGLLWFEETLCELASQFCLAHAAHPSLWLRLDHGGYSLAVQDYLHDLRQSHPDLRRQFRSAGAIRQWIPFLSERTYHRGHYCVIASELLPLFLEYPSLWRIIGLIGNSRHYESLEELLSHLQSEAPEDLSALLPSLRRILLGE